jgi:hypothetical protein
LLAFSFALNILLLIVVVAALSKIKAYREDRKQRGLLGPWPIRKVGADEFDARFATGPLGPDRATEIAFIANYRVEGGISDFETWVLCTLAKDARSIFELGTCTGKTAYLLAANSAPDAKVTTLTLRPEDQTAYKPGSEDDPDARASALQESAFRSFYYEGTPVAGKVVQLFGDSKDFDETPYLEAFDLVFVDGSHAKSYVESDSRKALRMVRPGGVVLWHDYRGPRKAKGVFQALNELAREIPLVHISGTALIAYRKPA